MSDWNPADRVRELRARIGTPLLYSVAAVALGPALPRLEVDRQGLGLSRERRER